MTFLPLSGLRVPAVLLALILVPACAAIRKPAPESQEVLVTQWNSALRSRLDYWTGYQGQMRTSIRTDKTSHGFRSLIFASLPGRLRMEAQALTGQTVGVFVSTPGGAAVWDTSENRVYKASDGRTVINHFFDISIDPDLMAHVLVATLPREYLTPNRWSVRCDDGRCQSYWRDPGDDKGVMLMCEFTRSPFALESIRMIGVPRNVKITYEPAVLLNPGSPPERVVISSPGWKLLNRFLKLEKTATVKPA